MTTTTDKIRNSAGVSFDPRRRTVSLVSGFLQADVPLLEDRLALTLGTKLEYRVISREQLVQEASRQYGIQEESLQKGLAEF